jgi:integrase/recombinase XerD
MFRSMKPCWRSDVQLTACHADPRTTTIYDRRGASFDRHAAYVVVAFVAGG